MPELQEVIESPVVKSVVKSLFDDQEIEIVMRPASYIAKLKNEAGDKVVRVILLPPQGFTANKISETSSHPEVRKARITIKGGIRSGKRGFNILKEIVKFAYFTRRDIPVAGNQPYALIDKNSPHYREEVKSARETFFAVKENGEGFYHNIINLSNEWILLILKKELRLQKQMNIHSKIKHLEAAKRKIIIELFEAITNQGDTIFDENKATIDRTLHLKIDEVMPVLIEGLNIYETGKHEPCTVYAIILKFAKQDSSIVLRYLRNALEQEEAPQYYLKELIEKIE